MKKLSLLTFLLTGCLNFGLTRPSNVSEVKASFTKVMTAVAGFQSGVSVFCTGVFTHDVLLTAEHCVDDGEVYNVGVHQDYSYTADLFTTTRKYRVIRRDVPNDLAVLTPVAGERAHAQLGVPEKNPALAQRVFVFGHPRGYGYHFTEGRVTSTIRSPTKPANLWFSINAPATFGNSGGPVLTNDGEILGIVSFLFGAGAERHLVGAIHTTAIRSILHAGD